MRFIDITGEQFARMSNEQIVLFLNNEAEHISLQSYHYLKGEIEKRNLDLDKIEQSDSYQRMVIEKDRKNTIEISDKFLEAIWEESINEKALGKTNYQIYNSMIEKGVDAEYAYYVIKGLKGRVEKKADEADTAIIVGWVFIGLGVILLIAAINNNNNLRFILYGTIVAINGIPRLLNNLSKAKMYKAILQQIEEEKEDGEEF